MSRSNLNSNELVNANLNIQAEYTSEERAQALGVVRESLVAEKFKSLDKFRKANKLGAYSDATNQNPQNLYEFDLDIVFKDFVRGLVLANRIVDKIEKYKPLFVESLNTKTFLAQNPKLVSLGKLKNATVNFTKFYDAIQELRFEVRCQVLKENGKGLFQSILTLVEYVLSLSGKTLSLKDIAQIPYGEYKFLLGTLIDVEKFDQAVVAMPAGSYGIKFEEFIEKFLTLPDVAKLESVGAKKRDWRLAQESLIRDVKQIASTRFYTSENFSELSDLLSSTKVYFDEAIAKIDQIHLEFMRKFDIYSGLKSSVNAIAKVSDKVSEIPSQGSVAKAVKSVVGQKLKTAVSNLRSGNCADIADSDTGSLVYCVGDKTSSFSFVCDTVRDTLKEISDLTSFNISELDIENYGLSEKQIKSLSDVRAALLKGSSEKLKDPELVDLYNFMSQYQNVVQETLTVDGVNQLEDYIQTLETKKSAHQAMTGRFSVRDLFLKHKNSWSNDPFSFLDEDPDFEWDSPDAIFKSIEKRYNWQDKLESHFLSMFFKLKSSFQSSVGGKKDSRLDDIENAVVSDILFGTGFSPLSDSAIHDVEFERLSNIKPLTDFQNVNELDFVEVYDSIFREVSSSTSQMRKDRRSVPTLRSSVVQNFWNQVIDSETGTFNADKLSNFEIGPYLTKSFELKKLEKLAYDSRNKVVRLSNEVLSLDEKRLVETGPTGPRGEYNFHEKIGLTDRRRMLLTELFTSLNSNLRRVNTILTMVVKNGIDKAIKARAEKIQSFEQRKDAILRSVKGALSKVRLLDPTDIQVEKATQILEQIIDSYEDYEKAIQVGQDSLSRVKFAILGDLENRSFLHVIIRNCLEGLFENVDFVTIRDDNTIRYSLEKIETAELIMGESDIQMLNASLQKLGGALERIVGSSDGAAKLGYTGRVQLVDASAFEFIEFFDSGKGKDLGRFIKSGLNEVKTWLTRNLNKWVVDIAPRGRNVRLRGITDLQKVFTSVTVMRGSDLLTPPSAKFDSRNMAVYDKEIQLLKKSTNEGLRDALAEVVEDTDSVFLQDTQDALQLNSRLRLRYRPVLDALTASSGLERGDIDYLMTHADKPEEGLIQFTRTYKGLGEPPAESKLFGPETGFDSLVNEIRQGIITSDKFSPVDLLDTRKTKGNTHLREFANSLVRSDQYSDLREYVRNQVAAGGNQDLAVALLSEASANEQVLEEVKSDLSRLDGLLESRFSQNLSSLKMNYGTLGLFLKNISPDDKEKLTSIEKQFKKDIPDYEDFALDHAQKVIDMLDRLTESFDLGKQLAEEISRYAPKITTGDADSDKEMRKEIVSYLSALRESSGKLSNLEVPRLANGKLDVMTLYRIPLVYGSSVNAEVTEESQLSVVEFKELSNSWASEAVDALSALKEVFSRQSVVQDRELSAFVSDIDFVAKHFVAFLNSPIDQLMNPIREKAEELNSLVEESTVILQNSSMYSEEESVRESEIADSVDALLDSRKEILEKMQELSAEDTTGYMKDLKEQLDKVNKKIRSEISATAGVTALREAVSSLKKTRFSTNGNLNKVAKKTRELNSSLLFLELENSKLYETVVKEETFISSTSTDFSAIGSVVFDDGKLKSWASDMLSISRNMGRLRESLIMLENRKKGVSKVGETSDLNAEVELVMAELALARKDMLTRLTSYADFYTPDVLKRYNLEVNPNNPEATKKKAIALAKKSLDKISKLRDKIVENNVKISEIRKSLAEANTTFEKLKGEVQDLDRQIEKLVDAYSKSFEVIKYNKGLVDSYLSRGSRSFNPFLTGIQEQFTNAGKAVTMSENLMRKYLEVQSKVMALGTFKSLVESQIYDAFEGTDV